MYLPRVSLAIITACPFLRPLLRLACCCSFSGCLVVPVSAIWSAKGTRRQAKADFGAETASSHLLPTGKAVSTSFSSADLAAVAYE